MGETAVSNGSCLTGPWEMELKRSIRYNVNNDPSSHCGAQDKSIKDSSHSVITILCQMHAENESERSKREWIPKHKAILKSCSAEHLSIFCHKMFTCFQWRATSVSFLSFSFLLACTCRWFAPVDLQLSGIYLEVKWSLLSPHRSPINEAILTNTFWRLWNHFWKVVFKDTSRKHTNGQTL